MTFIHLQAVIHVKSILKFWRRKYSVMRHEFHVLIESHYVITFIHLEDAIHVFSV